MSSVESENCAAGCQMRNSSPMLLNLVPLDSFCTIKFCITFCQHWLSSGVCWMLGGASFWHTNFEVVRKGLRRIVCVKDVITVNLGSQFKW